MRDFILLGLLLVISSAVISLQADFWKNNLANLCLNPLHCGYVMRESRIYESRQVSLPCSCLPGFLFGRAHVPLTWQRSKKEKNRPAILWKKHLWQAQPCAESKVTQFLLHVTFEVGYWDPLLAIQEEHVLSGHTLVCCSMCKTEREASRRTGSLVMQRFLFCERSFFNSCHRGSYDWFFSPRWIRTIKKQRVRNCIWKDLPLRFSGSAEEQSSLYRRNNHLSSIYGFQTIFLLNWKGRKVTALETRQLTATLV